MQDAGRLLQQPALRGQGLRVLIVQARVVNASSYPQLLQLLLLLRLPLTQTPYLDPYPYPYP